MAAPWPTRHRLRVTTRSREALAGPEWEALEALGDLVDLTHIDGVRAGVFEAVRTAVSELGGASEAAARCGVDARTVRLWVAQRCVPTAGAASELRSAFVASGSGHRAVLKNKGLNGVVIGDPEVVPLLNVVKEPLPDADDHPSTEILKSPLPDADDHPAAADADPVRQLVRAAVSAAGSQRALSRALGCGHASVGYWLSGAQTPREDYVRAMRRVAPGSTVQGLGMVYSEAWVEEGAHTEPPPSPVTALKSWASDNVHPAWFSRAVRRASGPGSLATWLGTRVRDGRVGVDDELALERVQQLEAMGPPPDALRALAAVDRLLRKRLGVQYWCRRKKPQNPLAEYRPGGILGGVAGR